MAACGEMCFRFSISKRAKVPRECQINQVCYITVIIFSMATSPYLDWIERKCSTPRASRVLRYTSRSTRAESISTQSSAGSPTTIETFCKSCENSLDDSSQVPWTPSPKKSSFSISQLFTPTKEQESLVCWTPSSPPLSAQPSLVDWTPNCSPVERGNLKVQGSETCSEGKLCSTRSTLRPDSTLLGKQLSYSQNSLDVEDSAFDASGTNEKTHAQARGDITFSGKRYLYVKVSSKNGTLSTPP